ncbi:MAG: ubiquinol-cytochrome c reductase iron-sulfur subunit [Pseudomonadota bacterium]|jgi:ubiquinol-cytochrome c reductase iron-sulfur subunit|uniref:Ubiquinol-cytochrome c reductase iron-sulfur subunit n=1 Tax=Thiothrix fructosivorans TaxID=111770 RepID=A0A8B0SK67_9GAMM|nr:ubiquinol-cytochrome c reductase iron-sulfur subunit [Thiothrix fructosivorans]MBO0613705.1 ubiquinol-cytochrome c reductase iron-sulfur subunit [Thiothrix fructosivorans]QTX10880.1 ubiquinol-cytochrome c reductase iron-sulfur subunit [Thiothrix fructosivorans]
MVDTGVDKNRRRVLIAATSVVGAAGVAAIATPFLSSWSPSARALAAGAPVEVPVGKVEPGQQIRVIWRGKPVWIVNRTEEMLAGLPSNDGNLKDPNSDDIKQQPEYAKNPARTREGKEKYLVLVGICTHLGCSPTYRPELSPADLGADWKGGWYCPCHGSRFDLAGRVFKNVPAGANLQVPPYYFKDDNTVLIGEDGGKA